MGHDPQANAVSKARAAEALADIGERAGALEAARAVLADVNASPLDLRRVVKLLLSEPEDKASLRLDALLELLPAQDADPLLVIAEGLANAGHLDSAIRVIHDILSDSDTAPYFLGKAASVWLSCGREGCAEELLTILRQRPTLNAQERASAAKPLADAGYVTQAMELACEILNDPAANGFAIGMATNAWLSSGKKKPAEELLTILDKHPRFDVWARAAVANTLAEAGHVTQVINMAHDVFSDPHADCWDLERAAKACLLAGDQARSDIIANFTSSPRGSARIAVALFHLGHCESAIEIGIQALSDSNGGRRFLKDAFEALLSVSDTSAVEKILAIIAHPAPASPVQRLIAADALATAGALPAAVTLWCGLLTTTVSPTESLLVLTRLLNTGHREQAVETLRDALSDPELRHPVAPAYAPCSPGPPSAIPRLLPAVSVPYRRGCRTREWAVCRGTSRHRPTAFAAPGSRVNGRQWVRARPGPSQAAGALAGRVRGRQWREPVPAIRVTSR